MMGGTIMENLKYTDLVHPNAGTNNTCLWNGSAVSVSNNGLDTRDYDEVVYNVDVGELSSGGTLDVSIFASDTNNPTTASIINEKNNAGTLTDATFTQFTTANTNQLGWIKCSQTPRYHWVMTYQGTASVYHSVKAILRANRVPVDNSPTFEIGY